MTSISEKSYATSRWENEGGATNPGAAGVEIGRKLATLGIAATQLTVYEWSGYRYTNARDAIAAAERGHSMSQETHPIAADNDRREMGCWHEWEIDGHQKRIVLCVETELEMRPGELGFDPLALEALVLKANEMMKSCPSPIDSIRIVPAR